MPKELTKTPSAPDAGRSIANTRRSSGTSLPAVSPFPLKEESPHPTQDGVIQRVKLGIVGDEEEELDTDYMLTIHNYLIKIIRENDEPKFRALYLALLEHDAGKIKEVESMERALRIVHKDRRRVLLGQLNESIFGTESEGSKESSPPSSSSGLSLSGASQSKEPESPRLSLSEAPSGKQSGSESSGIQDASSPSHLKKLLIDQQAKKAGTPSTKYGADFMEIADAAMKLLSTGGRRSDTLYTCICVVNREGPRFLKPDKFTEGSPVDSHRNIYGLVPTERGDFTKIQMAILNDVAYGTGSTGILVEWKSPKERDANNAQAIKINSLINSLHKIRDLKGQLYLYIIPQTVDKFDKDTILDQVFKPATDLKPVLRGGEAFDETIYSKGSDFWKQHAKSNKGPRVAKGLPFVVFWFNRTNIAVDTENLDLEQLREMRHRTNITTIMKIAARYRQSHWLCYAGDMARQSELITIKPNLDFRQSWKLPGQDTILSQDEIFDELAMISGQNVLHVGFRSGRLESLVMHPHQRVFMLENDITYLGNARAENYYDLSKRGTVFKPKPALKGLHLDEDTAALARTMKLKDEEKDKRPEYGLTTVPDAISEGDTGPYEETNPYNQYLSELTPAARGLQEDRGRFKRPLMVDHSHKELVKGVFSKLEGELPKEETQTLERTPGLAKKRRSDYLKVAFKAEQAAIIDAVIEHTSRFKTLPREQLIKMVAKSILRMVRQSIKDLTVAYLTEKKITEVTPDNIAAIRADLQEVIDSMLERIP